MGDAGVILETMYTAARVFKSDYSEILLFRKIWCLSSTFLSAVVFSIPVKQRLPHPGQECHFFFVVQRDRLSFRVRGQQDGKTDVVAIPSMGRG